MANPEYPESFQERLVYLSKYVECARKTLKILCNTQKKIIKFSPIFRYRVLEEHFPKKDIFQKFFKLKENFKQVS